MHGQHTLLGGLILSAVLCAALVADDWPEWWGPSRDGVWRETGILESFPPGGPKVLWRAPVGLGYSSPSVAGGRVYITDAELNKPAARENVRCLDAATGQPIWTHTYEVEYPDWAFTPDNEARPVATPLISGGKVYSLGRSADLFCLDAATGRVIWHRPLEKDYQTKDLRGINCSPLIEGDLLIVTIAKSAKASIVAFNKNTGADVWEALDEIPSNSSPIVVTWGGRRQLIVWAYKSVASLDPATGQVLWREHINTGPAYVMSTPIIQDDRLLLSGLMLKLSDDGSGVTTLWPEDRRPNRVVLNDTSNPLLYNGLVLSATMSGQFACMDAATGKQLWQVDNVTDPRHGASIHATASGGSVFLYTDRGDLILTHPTATGYQEVGRAHLLDPTYLFGGQKVAWAPPAYANRHIFVRSDKEIVCASLEGSVPARGD